MPPMLPKPLLRLPVVGGERLHGEARQELIVGLEDAVAVRDQDALGGIGPGGRDLRDPRIDRARRGVGGADQRDLLLFRERERRRRRERERRAAPR